MKIIHVKELSEKEQKKFYKSANILCGKNDAAVFFYKIGTNEIIHNSYFTNEQLLVLIALEGSKKLNKAIQVFLTINNLD